MLDLDYLDLGFVGGSQQLSLLLVTVNLAIDGSRLAVGGCIFGNGFVVGMRLDLLGLFWIVVVVVGWLVAVDRS